MRNFQFIKSLLETYKFSTSQKERFLKLVSQELVNSEEHDEAIQREIRLIKNKIGIPTKDLNTNQIRRNELNEYDAKLQENTLKKILSSVDDLDFGTNQKPISKNKIVQKQSKAEQEKHNSNSKKYPLLNNAPTLVDLMKQFSDNSKALKYTTHSWEHGRFVSYEDFIDKIKKEWNAIKDELKDLNPRLHGKISNFLFHDKLGQRKKDSHFYHVWGEKRLKFGWSSNALKLHMEDESNDPFACPIPEQIKTLDKKYELLYFDDYVKEFKNEIELREDNSALENLINELWSSDLGYDFVISQKQTQGISFFTDVAFLKSTLKLIFKSIKSRVQFPNIVCSINKNFDLNYIEFCITQKDSICRRSIDDPRIVSPTGGDFSSIIKNLKNLADFSIVSDFNDSNIYKVNYLISSQNDQHIEKLNKDYPCDGFTYILKFYV